MKLKALKNLVMQQNPTINESIHETEFLARGAFFLRQGRPQRYALSAGHRGQHT